MKEIRCDELDANGIGHPPRRPPLAEPCRHARRQKVPLPARHRIKGKELWRCVECGDTIRKDVPVDALTPALDRALAEMKGDAKPDADPRWKPLRELLTALMAWNAAEPADLKRRTDHACEAVDLTQARIVMAAATA